MKRHRHVETFDAAKGVPRPKHVLPYPSGWGGYGTRFAEVALLSKTRSAARR